MERHPGELLALWGLKDPPDRQSVVRAYRKRAQQLHPDRAGNTAAAHASFIQLREQYQLLLRYSSDPGAFSRPSSDPDPHSAAPQHSAPSPDTATSVSQSRAWIIPPGNITLRRFWPLFKVWSGGTIDLRYSRGYPCSCQEGCQLCHGSLMRFENVLVQAVIPPLNAPSTRVRLLGMGHRGDGGLAGAVILELVWVGRGGWKWNGQALVRRLSVNPRSQWAYCRSPSGEWCRIHPSLPQVVWTSPAGLTAQVQIQKSSFIASLGQSWGGICWAMAQQKPLLSRLKEAKNALFHVW